jgi:hypothetical protein
MRTVKSSRVELRPGSTQQYQITSYAAYLEVKGREIEKGWEEVVGSLQVMQANIIHITYLQGFLGLNMRCIFSCIKVF